jgi:hypothetical protein
MYLSFFSFFCRRYLANVDGLFLFWAIVTVVA